MFDCGEAEAELGRLTGAQLAARIAENHARLIERETEVLVLACAWADLYSVDSDGAEYQPLINRACVWGGEGTPEISEYAAAEFGTLQGIGMVAAKLLIGDALDLRHRLPRLWAQVLAGQVRAWQARKVAQATHALSWEAARDVDRAINGYLGMLGWPRFQRILSAAVLEADPELLKQREHRATKEKMVWLSDTDHGLKTLVAKVASGDGVWFMATVNRIAAILADQGDPDPVGARRAKAIGILAQPVRALKMLIDHQHDPDPTTEQAEEGENQPNPRHGENQPAARDVEGAGHGNAEHASRRQADPADGRDEWDASAAGLWDEKGAAEGWNHGAGDEGRDEENADRNNPPPPEDPTAELSHRSLNLDPFTISVDPTTLDAAKLRPRVVLHYHLSDATINNGHGLIRPEHGEPITVTQLKQFLTDTGCPIQVRPVTDPAATAPVDAYEIPQSLREAVRLRNLVDVFPYGTGTSRSMDYDHTVAYQPMNRGGPPGQTAIGNLGPLTRSGHRALTHARWGKRQPDPGSYAFRSPHGYIYLVTNHGTLALGNTPYAHAIWKAAAPNPARAGPSQRPRLD